MKLRLFKRRSGVKERRPQVSPQSSTSFDVRKWNALLNDDPGIAKIADRLRPLGQKWVDEFACLYLAANDKQRLPHIIQTILAAARRELEPVNMVQSATTKDTPRGLESVNKRTQIAPPDNPHRGVLLQAADALEQVDAHNRKLMDALHYFADLGTGVRSRDFANVKQEVANTQALINSSANMFLKLGTLTDRLHGLAAEEKSSPSAGALKSDERPKVLPIPRPGQKEKDEQQKRADMVLSEIDALLQTPFSHKQSTVADPHSIRQRDKEERVEKDEQRGVDGVISEIKVLLQEPGTNRNPARLINSLPSPEEVGSIQKGRVEQKTTAVSPRSQGLNAVENKSAIPPTPSTIHREPSEPEPSEAEIIDPLSQEMEALFGSNSGVFSKL
jgi:hypothetical protein